MVRAYARISRPSQKIERQIQNILKAYPEAQIYQEAYTGTKIIGRKQFKRLLEDAQAGDVIVFDSVSRMSRNAEEGIDTYFQLFERGVELVFLKEAYISTATYRKAMQTQVSYTGTNVDCILKGVNQYLIELAKEQIKIAFEQAQKEVDDLHVRTSEGMREAKRQGKQIGQVKGAKLNIKKKEPMKKIIKEKSKYFNGANTDKEVMLITGLSRNTFYKYKKELLEELMVAE